MKTLTMKLKLFNGVEIPLIGLGTYKMTDEHEVYQAVIALHYKMVIVILTLLKYMEMKN